MGCLCSKGTDVNDHVSKYKEEKENERNQSSSSQLIPPEEVTVRSSRRSRSSLKSSTSTARPEAVALNPKDTIIERPANGHRRNITLESMGSKRTQETISSTMSVPHGEQAAAGWPPWLTSVAGDAVKGWLPRSADSYEKLKKIGQGTYSSVYKARDLKTNKIVAMKKVRFVQMESESVRFMAREIGILRRLDHPNVMRLEALAISKVSGSLYLVFEYMEHDLAGLVASPKVKLTEPQIKCYMQQTFRGLEHCHSRGILHRDIKGANILVDSKGNLKIADFGLATILDPSKQQQLLTSRVVTLWYRAPELLLGATKYGAAIDLWSVGCILAELFTGKPIMPGRTEVEQMHKIFKLCGSPTEEYWKKTKLPLASSFRSQQTYKRRLSETFKDLSSSTLSLLKILLAIDPQERGTASSALKTAFFTTKPLPCDPSKLPRYPSSKELEVKVRDEEARRQRNESVKVGNASKVSSKQKPNLEGQGQQSTTMNSNGFPIVPPRVRNGCTHQSKSVVHPTAVGYSWNKKMNCDPDHSVHGLYQHPVELKRQGTELRQPIVDSSDFHPKDIAPRVLNNDSLGYMAKRNRILYSGPLAPPGGNMDDMLKEHERQIQAAVRKAHLDKGQT